jgi:hypothetical protein
VIRYTSIEFYLILLSPSLNIFELVYIRINQHNYNNQMNFLKHSQNIYGKAHYHANPLELPDD